MATQYVRYAGPVHRRVISEADWRSVRLTGDTVVWDASNGFAVPLSQFTEKQIEVAIKPDLHLFVTTVEEDFKPTPAPYDMTPREHRQWLENPVDVPALLEGLATGSTDLSAVPSVPSTPATDTTDATKASGKGSGR